MVAARQSRVAAMQVSKNNNGGRQRLRNKKLLFRTAEVVLRRCPMQKVPHYF